MAGSKPPLYLGHSQSTGQLVVFSGEGALLTVGPPGTGKSRGVAAWNLLQYPGSMLVTDPKGQLVAWSARHRANHLGQEIAVLDPFGLTGWPSTSLNPLASLRQAVTAGEGFRSEADRLAHLLLPDVPGDKDPYWRNGARGLLVAVLLYLAALAPDACDLPGLHRRLWLDEESLVKTVLDPMLKAACLNGALGQYAANLIDLAGNQPKQFGIFREEARQALRIFAADEPCGRACLTSGIDLARLLSGRLTVYLVLPPEYVASHGRWMGLITSQAVHAIMKSPAAGDCVFLLDEFPNLGRLPNIRDAIAQLREKGLRVWSFVQDLAQLEAVYGRSDAEAMRFQAEVLQVLGCRSVELARHIEARAGTVTEKAANYRLPNPLDAADMPSKSLSEVAVPVLPASRALNMPHGQQILVRSGFPVIVADVRLWRDRGLR